MIYWNIEKELDELNYKMPYEKRYKLYFEWNKGSFFEKEQRKKGLVWLVNRFVKNYCEYNKLTFIKQSIDFSYIKI